MDKSYWQGSLKRVQEAEQNIRSMIIWEETQDGQEYWNDAVKRLRRIIRNVEAKINADEDKV